MATIKFQTNFTIDVPSLPPQVENDFAATTNGFSISIPVLENDYSPTASLLTNTVAVTRTPTNGTASVDTFTGAITYTPNPGATNLDAFRYTVQDDLGAVSGEATVTVQIFAAAQTPGPTAPAYFIVPITSGPKDHRHPRLNDAGEVAYEEQ